MFSARVPSDLSPNRLTRARLAHERQDRQLIDLTESNPTRAGFLAPPSLLAELGRPDAAHYAPQPRGLRSAREAVAEEHTRRGLSVDPDRIVLTTSTSEAYSFLFKTLCDVGDDVLVPHPSYPLFEHLTALDGVRAVPYALHYDGAWHLDFDQLVSLLGARTRALLVVAPNNPTGSLITREELARLGELCAAHGVALIGDEVFADYPLDPRVTAAASVLEERSALAFSLGGLSKSVALPQLKLGWIAVEGPAALVGEALDRLDLVADTYLSVSTPVQTALPEVLRGGANLRREVGARVRRNYAALGTAIEGHASSPCTRLRAEGGWSAVIRVPAVLPDEELALSLLDNEGVLVHPGYFYDFSRDGFLALSLLVEPSVFDEGLARVLRHAAHLVSPPAAGSRIVVDRASGARE